MEFTQETVKDLVEKKIAFVERMGLKVLELMPGSVKLMAPLRGNENHIGSMYAGALFTLAEIPGGALVLITFDPTKCYPLIKETDDQVPSSGRVRHIHRDLPLPGRNRAYHRRNLREGQGRVRSPRRTQG